MHIIDWIKNLIDFFPPDIKEDISQEEDNTRSKPSNQSVEEIV